MGPVKGLCPMQGCMAPFVAAGDHLHLLDSWFTEARHQLFLVAQGTLSESDLAKVLDDWAAGRQHVSGQLTIKLSYVKVVPFLMAGIVHPDPGTGRRVAQECLQQFAQGAATAASDSPIHHRKVVAILHRDSPCHQLLLQFIGGADMYIDQNLNPLRSELFPMKFWRMVEQSAERWHHIGQMHIRGAPNHSEAYWSLGLRADCLQRHLRSGPTVLVELGAHCEKMANPLTLASSFRLLRSPKIAEALAEHAKPQKLREILRPMVYRCDA